MATYVAKVSQLIRCQPAAAFDAFADPQKLTRFWLSAASGPLTQGARVEWQFMVPGAVDTVTVETCEPGRAIGVAWSDGSKTQLAFSEHAGGQTLVSVAAEVSAVDDDLVEQVAATVEGYAIVLCDLKTFLETGRSADLVRAKAELIAASMAAPPRDA